MKSGTPVKQSITIILFLTCSVVMAQWKEKSHTEWSEKEAQKVLTNSPWVRTVGFEGFRGTKVKLDPSNKSAIPPSPSQNPDRRPPPDPRLEEAAKTRAPERGPRVNCRIRLLSAKPIREAFRLSGVIRYAGEFTARPVQVLTEEDLSKYIIIAISCDSKSSSNQLNRTRAAITLTAPAGDLQSQSGSAAVFLETPGGQRVLPQMYQTPRDDRLGSLFFFPRSVDGGATIAHASGELRFHMAPSKGFSIDVRFKLKDMIYAGKLEY